MSDSPADLRPPRMPGNYVRRSARVALLDPDRAVLLIRSRFRRNIDGLEWAWFLPGGGVEDGESVTAAAVREVAEETGLAIIESTLTHLAYAEGVGTVGELNGLMRDDIFVTIAPGTIVSRAGLEPHERAAHDSYRWWPVPELTATSEVIFPLGIAAVLNRFEDAQSWTGPVRLDW